MQRVRLPLTALLLFLVTAAPAAAQQVALGHEAYEVWRGIADARLSPDGQWVSYALTLENGDPELVVRDLATGDEVRIPRGEGARFSAGSTHLAALVRPARADTRQARLAKKKAEDSPKSALAIVELSSGSVTLIERVRSFALGSDGGDSIAYHLEKPLADDVAEADPVASVAAETGETEAADAEPDTPDLPEGTTLVVRDLATGAAVEFAGVVAYTVADPGTRIAMAASLPDPGVTIVDGSGALVETAVQGAGHYERLAFDAKGDRLAFLTDRDQFGDEEAAYALYLWDTNGARVAAAADTPGMPAGWRASTGEPPIFSADGARLFFDTAPHRPAPPEGEPMLDEERVEVDVWHWQDPLLQPMQLLEAEDELARAYLAVVPTAGGAVTQLGTTDLPDVEVLDGGNGTVAHGTTRGPYRQEISWDFPSYADHYRIDVASGDRTRLRRKQQGPLEVSPDGRWVAWWDGEALAWYGGAADGHATTNLSAVLGHAVHNEDHDWAYDPQPYGFAGWARAPEGSPGAGVEAIVYDRYDLWALDPAGAAAPRHVTSGAGRDGRTVLRRVDLDPDSEWIDEDQILLSARVEDTKDAGFWSVPAAGPGSPTVRVQTPHRYGRPTRAANADIVLYTRESVAEFPDLWVAGPEFADGRRISEANPQQGDYLWATAELTHWRSLDGEPLTGLIHKPANFDPSRKYPMMVTFYERNADNLHQHHPATPHRSVIRQTFYASRGYVVFTPDITYEVGYPGESALEDVVSGVLHMIDQGYVDPDNIGAQGHSWGGYQIAYMVTKTDIFKAAAGGAPVANMTSAYGGIRWGSGMSRMFQYEKTQSRLGGTLWEMPLRYLENSPLFWADKVDTPLMMMHNDHDGAVPWYQGIEMFTALRRLGKPTWLINYNGEPHWPTTHANKVDWNIRMQQFFDHYLKGEPAPRWLVEGIPAVEKGKTLGLELIDRGSDPDR